MGLEPDIVVGVVGNGAARGHRSEAGAAPGPQLMVDDVVVQVRAAASAARREAAREHCEEPAPCFEGQVAVRPGMAHHREQIVLAPVLGRDHGHHLLREHVERAGRHVQPVELAAAHGVEDRGALHQVVAGEGEEAAFRRAVHRVTGASRALQEGRDRARGAELADEVHVADVDPELQRSGGHEHLEIAGLEPLLGAQPSLPGQAAVVGGDVLLSERLGEGPGDPLRHAAGIDEDQRGAVRFDEGAEAPVDFLPDFPRHHRFERRLRQLQRDVALAGVAGVHDRAFPRSPPVATTEEARNRLDGPLRRGEADAGDGTAREDIQALEREGEMGAALVAGNGVDLVDDRGLHAFEHGAPALAGEEDVERLRRRHQDVRRLPAHRLARRARRVAGAHHGPDPRFALSRRGEPAVDTGERHLEVLVHVVAERLERRDVEHPGRIGERGTAALPDQRVDRAQEAREGLAGAGRRRDQGMSPGRDRLPRLCLACGRCAEGPGEPGRHGGMESVESHAVGSVEWRVAHAPSGAGAAGSGDTLDINGNRIAGSITAIRSFADRDAETVWLERSFGVSASFRLNLHSLSKIARR